MGIAIFQILASLEPCCYARSIVRMALGRLTEKHSSSDELNGEIVILILPPHTLLFRGPFLLLMTYICKLEAKMVTSSLNSLRLHFQVFNTILQFQLISNMRKWPKIPKFQSDQTWYL